MNKKRGFTLIETLVAVSIISMAILAPISLAVKSMSISGLSANQITATYLAQEGIEYIRFLRDNNAFYENDTWYGDLDNRCRGENGCKINPLVVADPVSCNSDCEKIKYDKEKVFFGGETGEDTVFTRKIRFEAIGDGNDPVAYPQALVTSTVTWQERFAGDKVVEVKTYLFDIR